MARILLVYAEGPMRDLLAAALEYQGHRVICASSGSIAADPAIKKSCLSRYDLIIADEPMRATVTAEVVGLLKSLYPGTGVVAISPSGPDEVDIDAHDIAGVTAPTVTLNKPFSTADLFRTVDGALLAA
jgi:CheY-like chemotaxis protein